MGRLPGQFRRFQDISLTYVFVPAKARIDINTTHELPLDSGLEANYKTKRFAAIARFAANRVGR